uniref:Uncharacterized protein n=1 Tax=Anguilla anguilla TaxID=7936 RepID=A0A0E9Q5N6_ANGAN
MEICKPLHCFLYHRTNSYNARENKSSN